MDRSSRPPSRAMNASAPVQLSIHAVFPTTPSVSRMIPHARSSRLGPRGGSKNVPGRYLLRSSQPQHLPQGRQSRRIDGIAQTEDLPVLFPGPQDVPTQREEYAPGSYQSCRGLSLRGSSQRSVFHDRAARGCRRRGVYRPPLALSFVNDSYEGTERVNIESQDASLPCHRSAGRTCARLRSRRRLDRRSQTRRDG